MISKEYMTAIVKVNSKDYYIRDYLGSVRGVVDGNGTLEQATDYHSGGIPSSDYGNFTADDRLHTGKEFNNFAGLAWYDNSARMYDPITTRFTTPDPLAEKYPDQSPYAHCANNPLKYIDPTGLEWMYDPTMGQSERQQIEEMKKNSKMFNQIYDEMASSKTVYTMKTADMTNKQDGGGEFNPSNNTITINKDNVSYMAIAEEVYHAYQSENKQGSAENQEYEAKSAATIMEIEARQGISTNMFENSFFNNITIGVYNSNKNTINPNHPSLNNDYIKGGTEFVNYNKAVNPNEVKYLRPVTQIPSVFMDLIKKVYK